MYNLGHSYLHFLVPIPLNSKEKVPCIGCWLKIYIILRWIAPHPFKLIVS